MATERLSRLEGTYEQVNERLGDYIERFAESSQRLQLLQQEIQNLRGEIQSVRDEMNANDAALRSEMNANIAGVRRESRWIGGIIIAGLVVTVLSVIIQPLM